MKHLCKKQFPEKNPNVFTNTDINADKNTVPLRLTQKLNLTLSWKVCRKSAAINLKKFQHHPKPL